MIVRDMQSRRNRIFRFVGASIVLATFVIKDGFRERVKDRVASLDALNTALSLRTGESDSQELLAEILADTDRLVDRFPEDSQHPKASGVSKLEDLLARNNALILEETAFVDSVLDLTEQLPHTDEGLNHQVLDLDRKLHQLRAKQEFIRGRSAQPPRWTSLRSMRR